MPELAEGLYLMLVGMGVVFVFLILLMVYMKFVPILSRSGKFSGLFARHSASTSTSTGYDNDAQAAGERTEPQLVGQKMKLNTLLNQISEKEQQGQTKDMIPDEVVAAISAAIYSHTGTKLKKIVVTTPTGATVQYNLWGVAGRQDQMLARDVTGQVGFQY